MKNIKNRISSLFLFSILIMLLTLAYFREPKVENNIIYKITVQNKGENKDDLQREIVLSFIKKINIKFPEVVLAQCILESANFKSRLYKSNNNLLGMKHPKQRPTMSLGQKNGYANFDSWKNCIIDYAIWQSKFARGIRNEKDYLEYLAGVYASDKNYKIKLSSLIHELREKKD